MEKERLEKISLFSQILASVVTIIGISLIVWQVVVTVRAFQVQTWTAINQQMSEINKLVIEHPKLYPYFNEGKEVEPNDEIYPAVVSMADMYLDFMDLFEDEAVRNLAGMNDNGNYWLAWTNYFRDEFRRSPALCMRYKEVKSWYLEKGLVATYAKQGCKQIEQKK